MQSLGTQLKQHLLAASVNALKILSPKSDIRISYDQLHKIHKRAIPMDMMKYRLALQMYKIYNGSSMDENWIDMNFQQNFNGRHQAFHINDCSHLKIGKNILCNRLGVLNNQIKLDWLNLSFNSFKIHCKQEFLTNIN